MLLHRNGFPAGEPVVFVAVIYYHKWPLVMLRSLRTYFPEDQLILVNNLNTQIPNEYYDNYTIVLENDTNDKTHGGGIDVAVRFLKNNKFKHFIHIEPDCVISSTQWANELVIAIKNGTLMAGPHKLPFGPIHPCPSIWDVEWVGTFTMSYRNEFTDHRLFDHRKMAEWLVNCNMDRDGCWLWCHLWDCGIKNWYEAAKLKRTTQTSWVGFKHFFCGRLRPPENLSPEDFSLIAQYLKNHANV